MEAPSHPPPSLPSLDSPLLCLPLAVLRLVCLCLTRTEATRLCGVSQHVFTAMCSMHSLGWRWVWPVVGGRHAGLAALHALATSRMARHITAVWVQDDEHQQRSASSSYLVAQDLQFLTASLPGLTELDAEVRFEQAEGPTAWELPRHLRSVSLRWLCPSASPPLALDCLQELRGLEVLRLWTRSRCLSLEPLRALPCLRLLSLHGDDDAWELSEEMVDVLRSLPSLRYFKPGRRLANLLEYERLTASLTQLQELELSESYLTDEEGALLTRLPALTRLSPAAFCGPSLAFLRGLPKLVDLRVVIDLECSDFDVAAFPIAFDGIPMRRLQLEVSSTDNPQRCFPPQHVLSALRHCRQLTWLELQYFAMLETELAVLLSQLPSLTTFRLDNRSSNRMPPLRTEWLVNCYQARRLLASHAAQASPMHSLGSHASPAPVTATSLTDVYLADATYTSAGLSGLFAVMPNLRTLHLDREMVSLRSLRCLRDAPFRESLQTLVIECRADCLTDSETELLLSLLPLSSLSSLTLPESCVPDESIRACWLPSPQSSLWPALLTLQWTAQSQVLMSDDRNADNLIEQLAISKSLHFAPDH